MLSDIADIYAKCHKLAMTYDATNYAVMCVYLTLLHPAHFIFLGDLGVYLQCKWKTTCSCFTTSSPVPSLIQAQPTHVLSHSWAVGRPERCQKIESRLGPPSYPLGQSLAGSRRPQALHSLQRLTSWEAKGPRSILLDARRIQGCCRIPSCLA